MNLKSKELEFWNAYLQTLSEKPREIIVEASIAGNVAIANQLLELYLSGKKTAGSSLVKDYELSGDPLPRIGNFWIILNQSSEPKCIVRTVKIEIHEFDKVPESVAIAEGEGDLSLTYWRKAHAEFFGPYLEQFGIVDLSKEKVITEFFEVVFK